MARVLLFGPLRDLAGWRERDVAGETLSGLRAALSAEILPDPDAVGASLYAHLEKSGNRPVRGMMAEIDAAPTTQKSVVFGMDR